MTLTLDEMDNAISCDSQANLLKTIRCPRDLKLVGGKLPKPQYESETPRMTSAQPQVTPDKKSALTELREMRLLRLAKARTDKKPLPKALLPTIQEYDEPRAGEDRYDSTEQEYMQAQRQAAKKKQMPGYGSDGECETKKKPNLEVMSRGLVKKLVRKLETDDVELRLPRKEPETSLAAKQLLLRLNQLKAPSSRGNCSDTTNDTMETRVSSGKSKSQNRVVAPRNIPDSKTPKNA